MREREVGSEYTNMMKSSSVGMNGRQMSATVLHRRAPSSHQILQQTFNDNMRKIKLNASQKQSQKTVRTHYTSTVHKFSLHTERKSQASTYYSLNNAVRQQAIKLDERETQAYYVSKHVGMGSSISSAMHSPAPPNNMMAKTFQATQAKDRHHSPSTDALEVRPLASQASANIQLSEDSEFVRQKKHVHDTLQKKYGKVNINGNKGQLYLQKSLFGRKGTGNKSDTNGDLLTQPYQDKKGPAMISIIKMDS